MISIKVDCSIFPMTFYYYLIDASPEESTKSISPSDKMKLDSNYLDIAEEASDVFGLGESPVLFARYPHSKLTQPDLPQPTNLLKPTRQTRTRASSVEFERKTEVDDANSSSPGTSSGGFKATEGPKNENTVPCVFKWTPNSAAALAKISLKDDVVMHKVKFNFDSVAGFLLFIVLISITIRVSWNSIEIKSLPL